MGVGGGACGSSAPVPYLGGRPAVEFPGRLEIQAGEADLAAAAAEEEAKAEEDPSSGRPHAHVHPAGARRAAEEVLEDGHGEEHGDEPVSAEPAEPALAPMMGTGRPG